MMQRLFLATSYQMGRVIERRWIKAVDANEAQKTADRLMPGKHWSDKGIPIRVLGIKAV